MQWLFKAKTEDAPVDGIDWIVMTANVLGVVTVIAASMHANAENPAADYATAQPSVLVIASND